MTNYRNQAADVLTTEKCAADAHRAAVDGDRMQALDDNNTRADIWNEFVIQMKAYLSTSDMLKLIYEYGDLEEAEKRLR